MSEKNHEVEENQGNENAQKSLVCKEKKLEIALENRKLELNFLWQRSAAFWVFNAAALLALQNFSTVKTPNSLVIVGICFLGFVAALTWSLVNRGGKFWYEHWENKIFEDQELKDWFDPDKTSKQVKKGFYRRRFSPSKVLIAFSDHVTLFWLGILMVQTYGNHANLTKNLIIFLEALSLKKPLQYFLESQGLKEFLLVHWLTFAFVAFIIYAFMFICLTHSPTIRPLKAILEGLFKRITDLFKRIADFLCKPLLCILVKQLEKQLNSKDPLHKKNELEENSIEIRIRAKSKPNMENSEPDPEIYNFVFKEGKWVYQSPSMPGKPSS